MLEEIKKRHESGELDSDQALSIIFQIYLPKDENLKAHGLELVPVDYGLHQLRQGGEFICEGTENNCLETAHKIMSK